MTSIKTWKKKSSLAKQSMFRQKPVHKFELRDHFARKYVTCSTAANGFALNAIACKRRMKSHRASQDSKRCDQRELKSKKVF